MEDNGKTDEILQLVRQERELNNTRFGQVSSSLIDLTKDMTGLTREVKIMKVELKDEIEKVYVSLSEDIQSLASDLGKTEKRVDKFQKKLA